MQRLGRSRAEELTVGMRDLVKGLPLGVGQALLLGGRERRRHIVQFGGVDTLEADGELAVLDRRRAGSPFDLGIVEDVGCLEWR